MNTRDVVDDAQDRDFIGSVRGNFLLLCLQAITAVRVRQKRRILAFDRSVLDEIIDYHVHDNASRRHSRWQRIGRGNGIRRDRQLSGVYRYAGRDGR
ncbi:MAG: hypothetical protein WBZ07_04690 [Candidatus Dormiibacterota bacterium]